MIIAAIAALASLGFIVFLVLSKKTSKLVKRAAIIALILIALSFVVCSIIILIMLTSSPGEGSGGVLSVTAVEAPKQNLVGILIVTAILLFFILITVVSLRHEKQKNGPPNKRP